MLSVGIVLSGKKVSLNVSEKTTVRELIKMYKNLNPYKKISLKTKNFNGVKIDKSEIYVTASPCYDCFKLIINAGIQKIYYLEFYRDERIIQYAKDSKVELINLSKPI